MRIVLLLICFLCACGNQIGDSANGDNRDNETQTVFFMPEPNEGDKSPNDGLDPVTDGENPLCAETMGVDGAEGFLWKPCSDLACKLVVLFPKEFVEKFLSVSVVLDVIGMEEKGEFTGFANGDRQHWRFDLEGGNYTGRVIAESPNGTCFWEVKNPSERQD